jgi:hypothetical protein
MRFAKEIVNGRQFHAYATAFGTRLGHSNYEGLSAKDGIVMFAFNNSNDKIDFVANFATNSPRKTDFMKMSFLCKTMRNVLSYL